MDEAAWIRLAQEGDVEAFEHLVRAYQTPVYNLAYRMLGDRMEAEDAAQETFLRAFQNIDRYDPTRRFQTWLLSIAAHYCIDRLRRRPTLPLHEARPSAAGGDPEEVLTRKEMREQVQGLLDHLPSTDRAVVVLYYWYDGSCEEIGRTLGMSASAVKSRLHRARRRLAQALGGRTDEL